MSQFTSDTISALRFVLSQADPGSGEWIQVPKTLMQEALDQLIRLDSLNASLERQKLDLLVKLAMP